MNITHEPEETKLSLANTSSTAEIMRVDLDGGFTVNESIPATDAAKEVLRLMKEQWFYDKQATKIRELQERIEQLEDIIDRAANRFFADGSDGKVATEMLKILGEMVEDEP